MSLSLELSYQQCRHLGYSTMSQKNKRLTYYLRRVVSNWLLSYIPRPTMKHTAPFEMRSDQNGQISLHFFKKQHLEKFALHWLYVGPEEKAIMAKDPFFEDDELVVVLENTHDLGDDPNTLSDELKDWLLENAPDTKWCSRKEQAGRTWKVFKFSEVKHLIHFKLRWQ
jgi:hypothetical protein